MFLNFSKTSLAFYDSRKLLQCTSFSLLMLNLIFFVAVFIVEISVCYCGVIPLQWSGAVVGRYGRVAAHWRVSPIVGLRRVSHLRGANTFVDSPYPSDSVDFSYLSDFVDSLSHKFQKIYSLNIRDSTCVSALVYLFVLLY